MHSGGRGRFSKQSACSWGFALGMVCVCDALPFLLLSQILLAGAKAMFLERLR